MDELAVKTNDAGQTASRCLRVLINIAAVLVVVVAALASAMNG